MFLENYSLRKLNSFGIDAHAKYFAAFQTNNDLVNYLEAADSQIPQKAGQQTTLILGGGSNILFTKNYDGVVLKNEIGGIERLREDKDNVWVRAGAGVSWHAFVLYCIENNLAGAENLSLIPGSVGAAPMQNIGAYGAEIKDIFYELDAWHILDRTNVIFPAADCAFGYRESIFKNEFRGQFVITSVTFRLNKIPVFNTSYGALEAELIKDGVRTLSIKAIADAVIRIRQSKLPDPAVIGNAGSFFKNPTVSNVEFEMLKREFPGIIGYPLNETDTKLAAGWLIEDCGWKGYRSGDAGCHEKQALVLVNYGNAGGDEILDLGNRILSSVKQKFDIDLQREVNVVPANG